MPWIDQERCTGCSVCIQECPVEAIELTPEAVAEIDDAQCIRCGRCHDACPQEAVRHDGERIPFEVADNLRWVRKLLEHYTDPDEKAAFMERMARFFTKQKKVTERTLAIIADAKANPTDALDTGIEKLTRQDAS
jgi:ferredoxin